MSPRILGIAALTVVAMGTAQSPPAPRMQAAAAAFVDSLSREQRRNCVFPFADPYRTQWHYTPVSRRGIHLGQLDENQKAKLAHLLNVSLGSSGETKVERIRMLERILREIEANPGRDPDLYVTSFFGMPESGQTWGWRYEGHHLSLNFTLVDGILVSSSPQFLGANPATVPSGPAKGTRVLAGEEDLARKLVKSLSEAQRAKAILEPIAPSEILSANLPGARRFERRGIRHSELSADQQRVLHRLLDEYTKVQSEAEAVRRQREIDSSKSDLSFAWLGGLEPGEGHYYRIQGKTFLIEYDNTQNRANHVHSVWRDFEGDFGRDVLKEHYRSSPHHAPRKKP